MTGLFRIDGLVWPRSSRGYSGSGATGDAGLNFGQFRRTGNSTKSNYRAFPVSHNESRALTNYDCQSFPPPIRGGEKSSSVTSITAAQDDAGLPTHVVFVHYWEMVHENRIRAALFAERSACLRTRIRSASGELRSAAARHRHACVRMLVRRSAWQRNMGRSSQQL
jgi:hypothetical protein